MKRNRVADSERFNDPSQFKLRDLNGEPIVLGERTWLANHWFQQVGKGKKCPTKKDIVDGILYENILETQKVWINVDEDIRNEVVAQRNYALNLFLKLTPLGQGNVNKAIDK